jgi:hypothetical protein
VGGGDRAAGAGAVLDDDVLAEQPLQLLADLARQDVGGAGVPARLAAKSVASATPISVRRNGERGRVGARIGVDVKA